MSLEQQQPYTYCLVCKKELLQNKSKYCQLVLEDFMTYAKNQFKDMKLELKSMRDEKEKEKKT